MFKKWNKNTRIAWELFLYLLVWADIIPLWQHVGLFSKVMIVIQIHTAKTTLNLLITSGPTMRNVKQNRDVLCFKPIYYVFRSF